MICGPLTTSSSSASTRAHAQTVQQMPPGTQLMQAPDGTYVLIVPDGSALPPTYAPPQQPAPDRWATVRLVAEFTTAVNAPTTIL